MKRTNSEITLFFEHSALRSEDLVSIRNFYSSYYRERRPEDNSLAGVQLYKGDKTMPQWSLMERLLLATLKVLSVFPMVSIYHRISSCCGYDSLFLLLSFATLHSTSHVRQAISLLIFSTSKHCHLFISIPIEIITTCFLSLGENSFKKNSYQTMKILRPSLHFQVYLE